MHTTLTQLQRLRSFTGEPTEFWNLYLDSFIKAGELQSAMILLFNGSDLQSFRPLAAGPRSKDAATLLSELQTEAAKIAPVVKKTSSAWYVKGSKGIGGIQLPLANTNTFCMLLFMSNNADEEVMKQHIATFSTFCDMAVHYQNSVQHSQANLLKERSEGILEVIAGLNSINKFLAGSMYVCNELCTRFTASRVSIGWVKRGAVKLISTSATDDFEKKMEAVDLLEQAMEEAVDQESEIIFPASAEAPTIAKDHKSYAKKVQSAAVLSIPIRKEGDIIAICTIERAEGSFAIAEITALRLILSQVSARLEHLFLSDRFVGKKLIHRLGKWSKKLVGPEHTTAKVIGLAASALLLFLCFVPVPYKISAPVILKTDNIAFITSPFEGYIEKVNAVAGDKVTQNQSLISLDIQEFLLEEASLTAEKNRLVRESEKARATGHLAEMRIAEAQVAQTEAKLGTIRARITQSTIHSPFNGIIVEGDLKERLGSPVKQGEILYKVGQLSGIYAELNVHESDIRNIATNMTGRIALAGRPADKFPIILESVKPAAIADKSGSMFQTRTILTSELPDWFRPGMTGIAKIDAGKKPLIWIMGHKTVDFLLLKFWW